MDHSLGEDGTLRHEMPLHPLVRVLLIAVGAFVIGITFWEPHPALWPLNIFTLFFGIIMGGAAFVGGKSIYAGLFGDSASWTISRNRIEVNALNFFRVRKFTFTQADIQRFEIRERISSEDDNTWDVNAITITSGEYTLSNHGSKAAAETMRKQIEQAFRYRR
ncbi:MAG: hypothetical protein V4441_13755 [Pseudomonadota bacterium]